MAHFDLPKKRGQLTYDCKMIFTHVLATLNYANTLGSPYVSTFDHISHIGPNAIYWNGQTKSYTPQTEQVVSHLNFFQGRAMAEVLSLPHHLATWLHQEPWSKHACKIPHPGMRGSISHQLKLSILFSHGPCNWRCRKMGVRRAGFGGVAILNAYHLFWAEWG
ncbi:ribosomal RNA large subunit methyltransferase H [Striga asiatica]|uniref:Ribosomal RNA large subunit methyltransferase H n=1 Tax=Striga asiatica TaxID=4170 RepID=A0A5A7P3B1_STRAF|nr:ribosomal RNA large subunit methyltransferase H [Striga asiatica]